MSKPIAVASGDVHFTLQTLELATSVARQMIAKAYELKVPLLLNGDTLDSKAVIRGEIANRLIELLESADGLPGIYINTGNHDLINQHGAESSLNFLRPYATVVSEPTYYKQLDAWIIPYHHDSQELSAVLSTIPAGSRLIVHQGVLGAEMGAYLKDSSSLPREEFANFRVIASHYHKRQDIKCGRPRKGAVGLFSYLGSPYSITFAEAHDGPKGFNVIYDDGSLELAPTNLRKHVVVDLKGNTVEEIMAAGRDRSICPGDLIWLKVSGPASELDKVNKKELGKQLFGTDQYKLDKIATEVTRLEAAREKLTDLQVLDRLVDQTEEPSAQKINLKNLARELLNAA